MANKLKNNVQKFKATGLTVLLVLLEIFRWSLLILSASYAVFWLIPPIRDSLHALDWFPDNVIVAVIPILFLLLATQATLHNKELKSFGEKIKELNEELVKNLHPDFIQKGEIKGKLKCEIILANLESGKKTLEVAGLTLNVTVDTIDLMHKENPKVWDDWTITLFKIDPDFIKNDSVSNLFANDDWENPHTVEKLKKIKATGVDITLYTYKRIPFLHGYKINETTFLIAFPEIEDTSMVRTNCAYERISGSGYKAKHYKNMFEQTISMYKKEQIGKKVDLSIE
ncbi:MAG: hypothetical protein FWE13_05600 [Firmicutes bacterium]|nr:hypothetical protein [Bacillota bacterium]